jgi:hypothetical protein
VNGTGGRELVYLTKGRMPARATTATVVTDTDCAADRNGISHCANILRLASGRRITVRHDHSMMNDPCLNPREKVRISSCANTAAAVRVEVSAGRVTPTHGAQKRRSPPTFRSPGLDRDNFS